MTKSVKNVARGVFVVMALAAWMLSVVSVAQAQQSGTLAQQIQGTWTLVSCVNEKDGQKFDVFGPNPKGLFILMPNGRFSMILMRADLPKFASNSRTKGTAEENQAVVHGFQAQFGSYNVVSEKDQKVNLAVEGASFPNWNGTTQERLMNVVGEELRVTNPTPAIGSGKNYLIWKRVK